ncbi:MAG: hypothetical protein AB1758_23305, partial [Candidatus Eremiobacterota bacterium]
PGAAPVRALVDPLRRTEMERLLRELEEVELEASLPVASRLLVLYDAAERDPEEVYRTWSGRVPDHHWLNAYSSDAVLRFEAFQAGAPDLFREVHRRLAGSQHGEILAAFDRARRLVDQGVPREQAVERALLGYLLEGQTSPSAGVDARPDQVRLPGVRLPVRGRT